MPEFHYDYIKNKNGNKSRLLLTNTDILVYEIGTENVNEYFSKNKEMFDFSDYFSKSKFFNDSNALVIDNMKDKIGDIAI